MNRKTPREGDIHEVVCVGGHSFTIRYGYYAEEERQITDPLPIYPCFITNPHYTKEGHPLVTRIQDACEYYETREYGEGDGWCADCVHCTGIHSTIGVCKCPHHKKDPAKEGIQ